MSKITVYISCSSGNMELKKKQQRIDTILGKNFRGKIDIEYVDISSSEGDKKRMRELAKDDHALPPQLAKGDTYLGDFEDFDKAVEDEKIAEFLQI